MDPDDIKLASVNWEHGMLLTPDHFLRQERYIDSAMLWILRYASNSFGLIGGGPRIPEDERGSVRQDPVVSLDEDANELRISVTQCRGLTASGGIIEIDSRHPLQCRIPKGELDGIAEALIYVTCLPREKEVVDGEEDQSNPQMRTERMSNCRLSVKVTANIARHSLVVARMRAKRYGAGYEKDPDFIPACTSMCSYSELIAVWRKIIAKVTLLSERYTALHRAMREFLVLFAERGIETQADAETLRFVDRMVTALQDCHFEILDSVQSPQRFFMGLRRFLHSAAVYLDLTPSAQQYFETLKEAGETEFIAPLEQQKQILNEPYSWNLQSDLAVEARGAIQSLDAHQRLERALEGKYLDFRISPTIEAMNFIFDRGGKVLYRLAAKPARVQGTDDELTVFFSQLRLEGRDKYRLILVGAPDAVFEKGTKIPVEIRVNEGSGFRRPPILLSCVVGVQDHHNFEFDFEAPDVPTITDLKVGLQAHLPFRTALMFIRHRFYAGRPQGTTGPVEPLPLAMEAPVGDVQRAATDSPPARILVQEPPPRTSRLEPAAEPPQRSRASQSEPWETPPSPPRRRRLE